MGKLALEKQVIVVHPFKTFRRKNDLTIGELAEKMGVNAGGISRIERGTTPCSRKFAKTFEKISGVPWIDLVALEPEIFRTVSEPRGRIRRARKKTS